MAPPRFQVVLAATSARDSPQQSDGPSAVVSWRLLGSNHRELGRSADSFDDIERCLQAIQDFRDALPNMDSQVLAHPTLGTWFWRIHVQAAAVAVSSRLYQRRRESVQSLLRTLENIPLVEREPAVLRLRTGRQRENLRVLAGPSRTLRIVDARDSIAKSASQAR